MRHLLRALVFIGAVSVGFVACDNSKENNNSSAPSQAKSGKLGDPDATLLDKNLTTEASRTRLNVKTNSFSKDEANIQTQMTFSYPVAKGQFQTITHRTTLTDKTSLHDVSDLIEAANGDKLQIHTLCILSYSSLRDNSGCYYIGARIYKLENEEMGEFSVIATVADWASSDTTQVSHDSLDAELPLIEAMKQGLGANRLMLYVEAVNADKEFATARIDVLEGKLRPDNYWRDDKGNRLLEADEKMFITIPLTDMAYPNNRTKGRVLQIKLTNTYYEAAGDGTHYKVKDTHKISEMPAGKKWKHDKFDVDSPSIAATLGYMDSNSGVYSETLCITDGCDTIHVMIYDEFTDPTQPKRFMGAYEFVRMGDKNQWELNVHSVAPSEVLTMDSLPDYFEKLIAERDAE